jgi:hypothetical protein
MRFCNLLRTMQDKADIFTIFVKRRGQIIVVQVYDSRTGYSFFYLLQFSRDIMTCPRILITAINTGNPTLCGLRDEEV